MEDRTLALVVMARDEAEWIGPHLAYHHALGVRRAWVFLDRPADATGEIAARFPWVTVVRRDRAPEARYLSEHQVTVLADGLARARAEGWRWLLHLDPDELACGHSPASPRRWLRALDRRPARAASLTRMLARVEAETPDAEAVVLAPNDVIATPLAPGAAIRDLAWTLRRGALRREILDPTADEVRVLDQPFGHDKGKSLVRLDAPAEPASAHRFRPTDGREDLRTVHRGYHFHYVIPDGEHWWRKYRRLAEYPDRWSSGKPVRFPKQAFKEAARQMTRDEAVAYFDRWLRVPRRSLVIPFLTGRVVHDPLVRRVLERVEMPG